MDVFNVPAICVRNAAEFKAAFMLKWKPSEASIVSKPAAKLLRSVGLRLACEIR